jgi:uncharacterized protein with FMN-binding domain
MKKNIKKLIATLAVGGTFFGYIFSQKMSSESSVVTTGSTSPETAGINNQLSQDPVVVAASIPITKPVPKLVPKPKPAPIPLPVTKPIPVSVPTPVPVPPPKTIGTFKDGTYTGVVADAFYGNVQVQTIVKNGVLADVVVLQYPNDRNNSVRINNFAIPQLQSEAIQAQSASVDMISGASATSQAFVQSLQSALDQAKV